MYLSVLPVSMIEMRSEDTTYLYYGLYRGLPSWKNLPQLDKYKKYKEKDN